MVYRVSICIPTYEMGGKGTQFLEHSLQRIVSQSHKDIQVVVSDHSGDNSVQDLCLKWSDSVDIKYIRNQAYRGNSSSNTNNAVAYADGDIIKILFQDDWLLDNDSIALQVESFIQSDARWSIAACVHTNDDGVIKDEHQPSFNDNILFTNTLSSPSTLMVYKDSYEPFDNELLWYMDTDCYYRLYQKHGLPHIHDRVSVVNRRHADQITNTMITTAVVEWECNYLKQKYERINSIG